MRSGPVTDAEGGGLVPVPVRRSGALRVYSS